MKQEFGKYLDTIGITNIHRDRVEAIYRFYQQTCPEEITGIFVTDYVNEDGSREYENLWFFSPSYCMEATRFIHGDDFDLTVLHDQVIRWVIVMKEYDVGKATSKARLNLKVDICDRSISGELKASNENCDYLMKTLKEHITPNLRS